VTIILKDEWLDLESGSVRFHAAIGETLVGGEVTQADMLRWFGVEGEDEILDGFRANWPQISAGLAARLAGQAPDQPHVPRIVSIDGMDPTAERITGAARALAAR